MKQLQKIAVLDPSLGGGVAHYTFALCNALAKDGCQVSLITSIGTHELDGLKRGFEIVPLFQPEGPPKNLPHKVIRRVRTKLQPRDWNEKLGRHIGEYLRANEVQVVHQQWITDVETEPRFWASLRQQLSPSVPLVYTAHNVWPHESIPALRKQYQALYQQPDRIIVHGDALRIQMVKEAQVPQQKISVIPHGNYHHVAEAVPVMPQVEARARLGLPDNAKVVLFLGAIRNYKGLDTLLLAFERLLRQRGEHDYRLIVAGSLRGETWDQSLYGGLCRNLKISEFVQVYQEYMPIDDFGLYFGAADVACFPYRNGSQSGALQLAYSYHKPVVATSVGSLPEAVQERRTGLLVGPEEPDALAAALRSLLDAPEQSRQMGEYAYEWSRDSLAWDGIAQKTRQVYQEVEETLRNRL